MNSHIDVIVLRIIFNLFHITTPCQKKEPYPIVMIFDTKYRWTTLRKIHMSSIKWELRIWDWALTIECFSDSAIFENSIKNWSKSLKKIERESLSFLRGTHLPFGTKLIAIPKKFNSAKDNLNHTSVNYSMTPWSGVSDLLRSFYSEAQIN